MAVTFTHRISWKERVNQLDYMYEWYGIKLPPSLSSNYAKAPKFVNMAEMSKLVRESARSTSAG